MSIFPAQMPRDSASTRLDSAIVSVKLVALLPEASAGIA
jgi:hypothetical protein